MFSLKLVDLAPSRVGKPRHSIRRDHHVSIGNDWSLPRLAQLRHHPAEHPTSRIYDSQARRVRLPKDYSKAYASSSRMATMRSPMLTSIGSICSHLSHNLFSSGFCALISPASAKQRKATATSRRTLPPAVFRTTLRPDPTSALYCSPT